MIIQFTTVHPRNDTRIFIKQSQTLAAQLSYKVWLVVADGKGNSYAEYGQVSVHDLGNLGNTRLARMLRGTLKAFVAVQKIKPISVHFHDPELIPLGMVLKLFGYKVIYDVHEDVPRQTLSKHYLPLFIRKPMSLAIQFTEMLGAALFDAIVAATPKIAERFPASKTITVQNFPISSELVNCSPIPYIERSKSFFYVGGIATVRGATQMLQAIDLLDDIPDARLDLAGTFSPLSLSDTVKSHPGSTSINYHGQVSRKQLVHLLGNSRAGLVLFHPIPNHIDAQPNKMFEYMSAGLPVIASDFPLWRKIIEGAGCGLLVDPMDPRAIADAMRWIIDHPVEAEEMGKRGRLAVEHTYNWDIEAKKLIQLYRHLINGSET